MRPTTRDAAVEVRDQLELATEACIASAVASAVDAALGRPSN
jgi:hypothetical protein